MKRSQTILFIIAVLVVLAGICAIFPKDGIHIFGMTLRFPTLKEVIYGDEEPSDSLSVSDSTVSAEAVEIDDEKLDALSEERKPYLEFMNNAPSRFSLPDDDPEFFDDFFAALDNASKSHVRVVHYGDSQIEEDRITSKIRSHLQERFGGDGPGLLPMRHYYTGRVGVTVSRELRRYLAYGDKSRRASGSKYGPFADFVRADTAFTVSIIPAKSKKTKAHYFNRAILLTGNLRSGGFKVTSGDSTYAATPGDAIVPVVINLPDSSTSFRAKVSGHGDIYGVLLDYDKGVSVDNVPMRGCSGSLFTTLDSLQLSSFYKQCGVKLIIMQYGGNTVPYIKTPKAVSNYKQTMSKQIRLMHSVAPDAKIIFIGPSDMATTVEGKRRTYPMLPSLVDSLRSAAVSNGAAYWSIYDAMGGEGSMANWVNAQPALAGPDYVHFTRAGADKMGEMFSDALMYYYDYYRWRKENE